MNPRDEDDHRSWLAGLVPIGGGVATILAAGLIAVALIEEIYVVAIVAAIVVGLAAAGWYAWEEWLG